MNEKKMNLISNVIKFSLIIIGVIACILVVNGPNGTAEESAIIKFRESAELGFAISFSGILIFACTGIVLLFFVLQLITNPKKGLKSIIGILLFVVLYIVLNAMGTADTSETLQLKNPVSDATVDQTHAGLITSMIGLAVAVLAVVAGPFMGRFRK